MVFRGNKIAGVALENETILTTTITAAKTCVLGYEERKQNEIG
jgi:hypothetical protein